VTKSWTERTWTGFGLTQTCTQVHAEYCSLWTQNLFVRGSSGFIKDFIENFLPTSTELYRAPCRVQVEWDHGWDDYDGAVKSLTSLARVQAHNPTTHLEFVPEKLAEGTLPEDDCCTCCIDEMRADDLGDEDWHSVLEHCICAPSDMDIDDWEVYQYGWITRSALVHNMICNDNKKWVEDIRAQKMTVAVRFGKRSAPL